MNRQEAVRRARELWDRIVKDEPPYYENQDQWKEDSVRSITDLVLAAADEEREVCAEVAEDHWRDPQNIAAAIRARVEK